VGQVEAREVDDHGDDEQVAEDVVDDEQGGDG